MFSEGDRTTIAWRGEHFPAGSGVRGTIALVPPRGSPITICDDYDLNTGSYSWTIGSWGCPRPVGPILDSTATPVLSPGSGYRIRVTRNDMTEVMDQSVEFALE